MDIFGPGKGNKATKGNKNTRVEGWDSLSSLDRGNENLRPSRVLNDKNYRLLHVQESTFQGSRNPC